MLKRKCKDSGMARGRRTIKVMVTMHCSGHHTSGKDLCRECADLLDYARQCLDRCPFGGSKPSCAKCSVHCYNTSMRAKIISVMRYAGPRMMSKHPILAVAHVMDDLKKNRPENREHSTKGHH